MTNAEITANIKTATLAGATAIMKDTLVNNNEWLVRGMLVLFARQTEDEKSSLDTRYRNARGFNSSDAFILTSFSKQWNARNWLSDRQLIRMRKLMPKYAAQLARAIRGEDEAATVS